MPLPDDPTKNTQIHTGTGEGTPVTGTADGAKHRLDVQALIDGGTFSLQPFVPVVSFDPT